MLRRVVTRGSAALAGLVLTVLIGACDTRPEFDLVVAGGRVIDGAGGDQRADVGITGDRIAAIGNLAGRTAGITLDASDRVVAPGFIDVDSRSGVSLLADGFGESHLRQGITSEILTDGTPAFWTSATADSAALQRAGVAFDWTGLNGYFRKLEAHGVAMNVGTLVPLSLAATEQDPRTFLDTALRDGAFGIVDDGAGAGNGLDVAASVVGAHAGVLMVPVESPLVRSEDAFAPVSGQARRVIFSGMSRLTAPGVDDLLRLFARANARQISAYGTVNPYADSSAATDAVVRAAFKYGGTIVGTGTSAASPAAPPTDASAASFGAFAHLLGHIAREEHQMTMKDAIPHVTSVPAAALQVLQRGIVRERYFADLVVLNEATIGDRATPESPNQYPAGIDYVIVNGVVVVTPRGITGARPGYRLVHNPALR
jgi:hypothetical protein